MVKKFMLYVFLKRTSFDLMSTLFDIENEVHPANLLCVRRLTLQYKKRFTTEAQRAQSPAPPKKFHHEVHEGHEARPQHHPGRKKFK